MSDVTVTQLDALTALTGANVANGDLFHIGDVDASASKKITAAELLNFINTGLSFDIDTVTATNAAYAPNSTFQVIVLDDDGDNDAIAVTFASALSAGSVLIVYAADNGGSSHTVVLGGSQTWDGTNDTATFNAAEDFVVVVALSATRVLILVDNSVTYST